MDHSTQPKKTIFSSIRVKFLMAFSIVIIISVAFVTYFPITAYSQRLESNSIEYSNRVLRNYIGNLDNYVEELDTITDSILYNFYIQRYLIEHLSPKYSPNGIKIDASSNFNNRANTNSDFYQGSTDALSAIIELRSDINGVYLLSENTVALYKSRIKNLDLEQMTTYVNSKGNGLRTMEQDLLYTMGPLSYYEDNITTLSLTRILERYDGQGDLGLIHMDVNLQMIEDLGNAIVLDDSAALLVFNEFGQAIFNSPASDVLLQTNVIGSDMLSESMINHKTDPHSFGAYIESIHGTDYQIVYQTFEKTGWTMATITPHNAILAEVNEVRNTIILISLVSLIIILLITFILATRITKPIVALKKSMDIADHNQFNTMVEVTSNDEIGDLSESFNHMIIRIKNLMDQVVTEQEEKRSAEIKVLQDQINPHFLYNTLDTIIWMSETEDENTVPMIEALSKLFRLSLNRGEEFITIANELEHIKNYLYILQIRYLDKFDYTIDAKQELLSQKIPKIILQPLLENAIYHGIKNISTKGHVLIKVATIEHVIHITITDNGIGMDEVTCNGLLMGKIKNEPNRKGSGVGIRNVNARIKLYYGDEYGLNYKSTEGIGTTVTVTMPMN